MAQAPLSGIRVLDLTNVLAGPFCCHHLAHMGADVIKVELPGSGDLARQLGADAALNRELMGVSFLAQNPGKRSITVDLKHPRGKAVLCRLVAQADVLVENFRPGVMARLGLDYAALARHNPRLIYCAISGFGQDGPLCNLPAYDQIIQGMAGVMAITGAPETAPYRVGYPVADTVGGLTAAFAIAAQLAAPAAARGGMIDVAMLEAVLATMGWVVSNFLIAGQAATARGNDNMTASPSGTFTAGDGPINIAANKQAQFEALCAVIGRPDLSTDPRFADRQARLDNRAVLSELINAALATRPAAYWCDRLTASGVPAGPVLGPEAALDHPQIRDRGLVATFTDVPGTERDIRVLRPGFKVDGRAPKVDRPPPQLGAHSDDILAEIGYGRAEIAALRQEGVI